MSPFLVRLLTVLALLVMVVFSFLPVPGTTLIMLYVVLFRPQWFKRLVDVLYSDASREGAAPSRRRPDDGGSHHHPDYPN